MKVKTVTASQMRWMLAKGYARVEGLDDDEVGHGLGEIFWTREGGYVWDEALQVFVMAI